MITRLVETADRFASRSYGTFNLYLAVSSDESLGYYRKSLRDFPLLSPTQTAAGPAALRL
jgi:hypothetical protein